MNDKWTAVQISTWPREFVSRPPRTRLLTGGISPDDWSIVDEREIVVAMVSPETYWETNDPVTAQTRAHLMATAPEMAALLREIAQLPPLLDGTNRSAVVITDDLRQRIGEVLLKSKGFEEWPY